MIPFVPPLDVVHGRRDQVSPLIQRVVANNPGPFTYTGTGTYIVGWDAPGSQVCVIDPGPLDLDHLEALLTAVGGRRVSHVLITHTHSDHSPLARPFASRTGATILAARPPAVETHVSISAEEGDDDAFMPDTVLMGGETIGGDGWTIHALATPGHASNHMAYVLEQENALFSGDHVMGWSTTVVAPPDGDMTAYMASLDAVIALDFDTLWPTHGGPITDPATFLGAYRTHRLAREAQIMARLAAGDRTVSELVPNLYAAVDRRLWPAASRSVLAHLIKLVAEGRIIEQAAPGSEPTYRPA